jgi:hypothetical protein
VAPRLPAASTVETTRFGITENTAATVQEDDHEEVFGGARRAGDPSNRGFRRSSRDS